MHENLENVCQVLCKQFQFLIKFYLVAPKQLKVMWKFLQIFNINSGSVTLFFVLRTVQLTRAIYYLLYSWILRI